MWIFDTIHGIQLAGNELARNENKQKNSIWFLYSNSMTNFEAFPWNISSSINLLLLKNAKESHHILVPISAYLFSSELFSNQIFLLVGNPLKALNHNQQTTLQNS